MIEQMGLQVCVEWMDMAMVHYGTINYFGVDATLIQLSKIFSFLVASSNCSFFFILLLSGLNYL